MSAKIEQWKSERLPEVKKENRADFIKAHVRAMRKRADKFDEPLRSELIAISVAMGNLVDFVVHEK